MDLIELKAKPNALWIKLHTTCALEHIIMVQLLSSNNPNPNPNPLSCHFDLHSFGKLENMYYVTQLRSQPSIQCWDVYNNYTSFLLLGSVKGALVRNDSEVISSSTLDRRSECCVTCRASHSSCQQVVVWEEVSPIKHGWECATRDKAWLGVR